MLEDLGWYVADNLPPELIARMVDFGLAAGSRITQLAVVMDVRSRGFTGGDLDWVRNELVTRGIDPRVLFMEASDDILVRRYESNRRSHPLQGNQTLAEGIAAERAMLAPPVRASADLVIDTSTLSVHGLRESIERAFAGADRRADQRHGRIVRVQVRAADGLRHGDGRSLSAEPALGGRVAGALGPAPGGPGLRPWPTGRRGVPADLPSAAEAGRRGIQPGGGSAT